MPFRFTTVVRPSLAVLLSAACTGDPADGGPSGAGGAGADVFVDGAGGPSDAASDLDDAASDAPIFDPTAFPALDPALCPAPVAEMFHDFDPGYTPLRGGSWQTDKAFYLFTLLAALPDARAAVVADQVLASLTSDRAAALGAAVGSCSGDVGCWAPAAKWSDADIARAGDALALLHASSSAVDALVGSHLRKSGHAQLHAGGTDAELLRQAWLDAARALNQGFDSAVAPLETATANSLVAGVVASLDGKAFYASLLELVQGGLDADGRDEAERYEPLADGANELAIARIASIEFSKHPFAAIVVLGQGPTDLANALDPRGQVRADQAAARYTAGLAPLIALSGGHVHPDRTPYSEAIEMKKYLMATYSIPESALLVDPHARHTTTNLRNVARQIYRHGLPADMPFLVTTDSLQTIYISLATPTGLFGARCLAELGYLPYRGITKLDPLDSCWVPAALSLHADARDLLDP